MRWLVACLPCAWLAVAAAQTCMVCGEVRSVREVNRHAGREPVAVTRRSLAAPPSGLGSGPPVGAVAALPFGGGASGGWQLGAAGTPEMQARLDAISYEITVAMDSGEERTLERRDGSRFHIGQRVALRGGELEPR